MKAKESKTWNRKESLGTRRTNFRTLLLLSTDDGTPACSVMPPEGALGLLGQPYMAQKEAQIAVYQVRVDHLINDGMITVLFLLPINSRREREILEEVLLVPWQSNMVGIFPKPHACIVP